MTTYTVQVDDDGNKFWCQNGNLHRTDGPAVEYADGGKLWYQIWYQNGNLHRTDGPAVEYADGGKLWYQNGNLHRTDGPAVEYANGSKEWYQNDKLHRADGPAVEYADGTKRWYLKGLELTEAEWRNKVNPAPTCDGKVVEVDGKRYKLVAV